MIKPSILSLSATLLLLAACSTTASHVPNPLLLPGQAVATGLENAAYNARRSKVSAHVKAHHALLIAEIENSGGAYLNEGFRLARVPPARHPGLRTRLREDIALYRRDPEALVVALMVHGS